jgi:magnesium chelatase subunit H
MMNKQHTTVIFGLVGLLLTGTCRYGMCFLVQPPAASVLRTKPSSTRLWVLDTPRQPSEEAGIEAKDNSDTELPNIVLVAGFESFNRELYQQAAKDLPLYLQVFADSDIRVGPALSEEDLGLNPKFVDALKHADAFVGSLIFDYDDALAVKSLLPEIKGPRLIFESATELMTFNQVGSFSMATEDGGPSGPPPAVKAVLSKFSAGKEEDKISGYLKLLKIGPSLLKFVPGEKASDLRTWLEAYRYWNQGGKNNVRAMLQLVAQRCRGVDATNLELPELEVTPDIGLLHPLKNGPNRYFTSPASYLSWRLSPAVKAQAEQSKLPLALESAPRVAFLLYRKHVITEQKYIEDLITEMESQGILPIPIFINGVEAHTIVRDMLTSQHEIDGVAKGRITRDSTYQPSMAVRIDAIVNTIGFPLVGGPAGSMEAGRNADVASALLRNMNVPYIVASPLLLQSIPQWKTNGVLGLQSVVLYSLPELDGAIDTVVLGGLVGDKIALVPERVRKLASRVKGWVDLRRTPPAERRIAISIYGFPPNVGAVGTAALLDVPHSLEALLQRLDKEGYDVGEFSKDPDASGESIVAALGILSENTVIAAGADYMQAAVETKMERARNGDKTVAATLARPGGGLGGGKVWAKNISRDELDHALGKYMSKKVRRAWSEKDRGPGVASSGDLVVSGIQLGNVFVTVQPLLGVEGDPMRLLFERDLTPHPQYCAAYEWLRMPEPDGGIGAQAVIHLGMHGTVEWLPGQPLGNDRKSWSDELLGELPNIYVYAANNPSESILAKRRGYGTLVSYNVPPYGRAGLYLELANLKELISDYRMEDHSKEEAGTSEIRGSIYSLCQRSGIIKDVPLLTKANDPDSVVDTSELPEDISLLVFDEWVRTVSDYLVELQERLFSSGLHTLGRRPSSKELASYLQAYFGDKLSEEACEGLISTWQESTRSSESHADPLSSFLSWFNNLFSPPPDYAEPTDLRNMTLHDSATQIVSLLSRSTEELDAVINSLDGGYVAASPGGDLLRDGPAVLPTGRNIHALDPYRMPSAAAWTRGQLAAEEILKQHKEMHNGAYPETVAVTLWGLDAIKTKGESVAIVLSLVGATPVREGTGRIVRFDLLPLEELGRPRIDVLASLSGIFR